MHSKNLEYLFSVLLYVTFKENPEEEDVGVEVIVRGFSMTEVHRHLSYGCAICITVYTPILSLLTLTICKGVD